MAENIHECKKLVLKQFITFAALVANVQLYLWSLWFCFGTTREYRQINCDKKNLYELYLQKFPGKEVLQTKKKTFLLSEHRLSLDHTKNWIFN